MPSRLATSLALALLSSLAACDDSTGIVAADIACPTPQTLTYANYGQAVIAAECLDCHTTKERPFLDTQARVQQHATKIIETAVYHSAMPEDGSMTNAERIQLGQWLTCGAP
ncbi:MAG: hypothetical protein IPH44_26265 [Myxococcales bacterium]|nr:hypothetical protein [Myxococcales bacterium]MBK7195381.1 hypothetical protein [Myxococcales bacterium]